MFLLMFSILWELLVLCSRLHLGRIIFSPLKKIGKNQSFLLKATLYCVAARKENVPFPSFLSLSRQEQTAALAPEMPPQSIPSLRAWVRGIGSAWWSSHPWHHTGLGGCWEGCPVNVSTQSPIMWHWPHSKAAFSSDLRKFHTKETDMFIPSHLSSLSLCFNEGVGPSLGSEDSLLR